MCALSGQEHRQEIGPKGTLRESPTAKEEEEGSPCEQGRGEGSIRRTH